MHTLLLYGLSVLIGILTGGLPGFYFLILSRACVGVFRRITLFSTQHGALCVCVCVCSCMTCCPMRMKSEKETHKSVYFSQVASQPQHFGSLFQETANHTTKTQVWIAAPLCLDVAFCET